MFKIFLLVLNWKIMILICPLGNLVANVEWLTLIISNPEKLMLRTGSNVFFLIANFLFNFTCFSLKLYYYFAACSKHWKRLAVRPQMFHYSMHDLWVFDHVVLLIIAISGSIELIKLLKLSWTINNLIRTTANYINLYLLYRCLHLQLGCVKYPVCVKPIECSYPTNLPQSKV